ncbi:MAG: UvrD-helicase domain-containing protein [Mycoplasmatales bacterium]|nr:UvrD-helicase domain-containing protein [Mycoplasmatales bacterium]
MKDYLENLNKNQTKAVLITTGPLAIIAGAGSGKTKTITHKISYLINEKKINQRRILAVTFTNKAATEMKERLEGMIEEKAEPITISTYHSLGARILRQEISALGYPKNFNILDNIDQKLILSPLYKKYGLSPKTHSYNSVISYISKNKILGISPETMAEDAKKDNDKIIANIYKDYSDQIRKIKSVDFDDLLILVHKIFKENPKIAKKWSDKFDYVLVDEFQDTSWIQYEIIKMLSQHNNITIVGDPDQTIYTWRQADVNLINNFQKYFKNSKIIKLEENYRSTKTILDGANKLIVNNKHRIDKKLISSKGEGDIIEFHHAFSEDAEARWVIQKINLLRKERMQLKNIAILYRANYLSAPIEKALINAGINYVVFGGVKFFQRQEVKDSISFLKIIANGDEIAMRRMINIPSRKIGKVALEKLVNFSSNFRLSIYDAIMKHFDKIPLSESVKNELVKFMNLINKYRRATKTNSISLVLSKFLIEVNYYSVWDSVNDAGRIDNIKELIKSIKDWEKQNPNKGLHDYLEEISLYTEKSDHSFGSDYVSLMTAHSAKGLEYRNVFIIGFSEGIFPSKRALDEGGKAALEEERRLAYVAITRAMDKLFITDARGFSIDHRFQRKPSRFITEMGIDVRSFTNEFIAPNKTEENYIKNRTFLEGDEVAHVKFGRGVVVNVQNDIIEIAFKSPHGNKTLMKNHKSLERIG